MENILKMLLTDNKKALQFLHCSTGFDFEKPYFLDGGEGRFTFNQVQKMIPAELGGNCVVALLVLPQGLGGYREKLHAVKVGAGRFLPKEDEREYRMTRYYHNIDDFFSVGDFEETRKNRTARYYVIAQARKYITLPQPKRGKSVDPLTRYKLIERPGLAGDGHGKKWISRLSLVNMDDYKNRVEWEPWSCYYLSETRPEELSAYIDKSGYIVRARRQELARAARARKAEKDRAAAAVADFSGRENAVAAMLENTKRAAADAVALAGDPDRLFKLGQCIQWALKGAFQSWAIYQEKKTAQSFTSPADMEDRLQHIETKLREVLENV